MSQRPTLGDIPGWDTAAALQPDAGGVPLGEPIAEAMIVVTVLVALFTEVKRFA